MAECCRYDGRVLAPVSVRHTTRGARAMTIVDLDTKIPNNVGLSDDLRLQRGTRGLVCPSTSTGGARSARSTTRATTCSCARRSQWARRAGRTSTTCGCPSIGGASSSPTPNPTVASLRRPQGRAGMARGAGRARGELPPPPRRARRHGAGVGRAAAAPLPDRAEPLRHAQPLPGERGGRPSPVGDGVPPAPLLRS